MPLVGFCRVHFDGPCDTIYPEMYTAGNGAKISLEKED